MCKAYDLQVSAMVESNTGGLYKVIALNRTTSQAVTLARLLTENSAKKMVVRLGKLLATHPR